MKKSVLKSKTFWVNLAIALAPLFPVIKPLLTEEVIVSLFGLVNIGLRMATSEAVSLSGK